MPINMPQPHGDKRLKCGQCKWFYVGYRGKTCQKTREVLADTPSCIEFLAYANNPLYIIKSDKYISELEKTVELVAEEYLKNLVEEISGYHLFDKDDLDPRSYMAESEMLALSHKFETCQAYTDRIVEIKNDLRMRLSEFNSLMKDAQGYLFNSYMDHIRALKNDSERSAFYRNILPRLSAAIDKVERVLEKADLIHSNLKDTHYSMCRVQDGALEVWKSRIQNMVSTTRSKI